MKSVSSQKKVDSTLNSIRKRAAAYTELADKFGPIFLEQARLRDEFSEQVSEIPPVDAARFNAGVPVLVDVDFSPWTGMLRESASRLIPLISKVLQLPEAVWQSVRDHLDNAENISGFAQARIEGNWKYYENTSVQLGTGPNTTLLYISETVFAPVLRAMVDGLGEPLSKLGWDEGYCPVCGSTPSISHLSPKEVTDLDQLVGGGGKKYLHCSLCGHDWRYRRNACAACGNDENESREIFYVDDARYERIEACHKCGKYCLSIDMREVETQPNLDAVQIGLIHLDLIARQKNLTPISPTLWNASG